MAGITIYTRLCNLKMRPDGLEDWGNTHTKTLYRNELRKPQQNQANSPTYAQKSYCKNP
jgi:hypothetical protein